MINGTGIDLDGLAEVAQRSDAVGVDSKVLLQLIEKSRHPGFSVVRMPTNADEAAAMEMLGFRWLADNAPDRLAEEGRKRAAVQDVIHAACALIASDINVYPMMSRADAVASGYDRLNAAVDKWTALQPAQCVTAQSQPIASQPETP